MKYTEPLNSASYPERNGSYVDANPTTGIRGSTVPGKSIEAPQREIVSVITAAGLTPNEADNSQLLQALYIMTSSFWENIIIDNIIRTTDTTIAIPGDVRVSYPKGKRLRFNGADTYLCRVYGEPVYSGGSTTITVWFDTRTTIIPTTITTMERSRLTPQDTANGTPMHGTDSAAVQATLMASYCCGCYISD